MYARRARFGSVFHVRVSMHVASCLAYIYKIYTYTYICAQILQRGGRFSCYGSSLLIKDRRCVDASRIYSRTTHRINKIYPWTTHVRLSYFKNLPPHSGPLSPFDPCGCVDSNFNVAPTLKARRVKKPSPSAPLARPARQKNSC